jgi:hypothetical protein
MALAKSYCVNPSIINSGCTCLDPVGSTTSKIIISFLSCSAQGAKVNTATVTVTEVFADAKCKHHCKNPGIINYGFTYLESLGSTKSKRIIYIVSFTAQGAKVSTVTVVFSDGTGHKNASIFNCDYTCLDSFGS